MNELNDRSVPFYQILRQRRMELRLRQAEIAAELRVEPETIGHWESGRRRMELNKVPRMAAILHLNAKDLCRLALFEWHPRLHDALFGTDRPQLPQPIKAPLQNAESGRELLPSNSVAGHPLETGVIVGNGLGQPKELT